MAERRIVRIESAGLPGAKRRKPGGNARLVDHTQQIQPPIARILTDDGAAGFGWSSISKEEARGLVGSSLGDLFQTTPELGPGKNVREPFRALEYPLWDLAAKLQGKPVYALVGGSCQEPYRVRCYDTTLLIDDLHLEDDDEAAHFIASWAQEGYDRGHRAFKIKVGRGAMHLPLEKGTRRDIRVIRAVRELVGPGCRIMLDVNNGYLVNLVKRVLTETADAQVYWIEEPFHEDAVLYRHLKEWLNAEGLSTLIADGEGSAHPRLLDWARDGLVDVVQYDVLRPGFSRWLELGQQLDGWGARSAPHHFGGFYGNYASCHLSAAILGFEMAEWDEAIVPGLDGSAYTIVDGWVHVPDLPGFGLELDEAVYAGAVAEHGFVVSR